MRHCRRGPAARRRSLQRSCGSRGCFSARRASRTRTRTYMHTQRAHAHASVHARTARTARIRARADARACVCTHTHARAHTRTHTHTRTHNRHCARPAFFPSLAAELALTLAGARPFAAGGSRVLHCMARVRRLSGDAPCCNAAGKHAQYDLALDRFRDALAHTPRSTKARLLPLPPGRPPTPSHCHGSLCVRSCTCVRWRACACVERTCVRAGAL